MYAIFADYYSVKHKEENRAEDHNRASKKKWRGRTVWRERKNSAPVSKEGSVHMIRKKWNLWGGNGKRRM